MIPPYVISLADTVTTAAVSGALTAAFGRVHPEQDSRFIHDMVVRVEALFRGDDLAFEPIDMAYHNLEHTWQTAICLVRMYEGRAALVDRPVAARDFRRALAAMLYHDTGYLKEKGDRSGSGAKYTFVHESRSAALATRELLGAGWPESDVESVAQFIRCTGPMSRPDRLTFANSTDAELGAMVCTADFLGQMSDPAYLTKLPALYAEFVEAYETRGILHDARPFASFDELWRKTPAFWEHFVLPKLHHECGAVYRYLATSDGRNPYLEAVEAHMRTVVASDFRVGA